MLAFQSVFSGALVADRQADPVQQERSQNPGANDLQVLWWPIDSPPCE
jgi:hypothetical protein